MSQDDPLPSQTPDPTLDYMDNWTRILIGKMTLRRDKC